MSLPELPDHGMFEKWWPKHGLKVWRILFTFVVIGLFGALVYLGVRGYEFLFSSSQSDQPPQATISCAPGAVCSNLQSGGLTVGSVTVVGVPDRILTPEKGDELLRLLPSGTKKITIVATMGDDEAYRLGEQIRTFLLGAGKGFEIELPSQGVFLPPFSGVQINTKDPSNVAINIGGR